MKQFDHPSGPPRPKRLQRKLKKRIIDEFSREVYKRVMNGTMVARTYRPLQLITDKGFVDAPQNPKMIGKLVLFHVLWDGENN